MTVRKTTSMDLGVSVHIAFCRSEAMFRLHLIFNGIQKRIIDYFRFWWIEGMKDLNQRLRAVSYRSLHVKVIAEVKQREP